MKLLHSHLLGTIIVSALSSACALDHETLSLKNSLAPKVLLPTPGVQAKGEYIRIEPALDRAAADYHPISDGLLDKTVQSLVNHGLLSESGSAVDVRGLGEKLFREKDGVDIVGSEGVASAMKQQDMYSSALESAGPDRAAVPRIELEMDRDAVDYQPTNDGIFVKSVESLNDHGVLSGSGSAVSVLGLGETLLREKDGADIVSSYVPAHAEVRHDDPVIVVDRKLQSGPCPALSADEFRAEILACISGCTGPCESDSFGTKLMNEWCTSSITDMTIAFRSQYTICDISAWDVSSVTNMDSMFNGARFNLDLNAWDTSSVKNMKHMFMYGYDFNRDLNAWDTSSVTTMKSMFMNQAAFNQNLNAWDVSSVTSMYTMFPQGVFNQDLNSWNVSSVTTMYAMFHKTSKFNQNLNAWDVSSVTTMHYMFGKAAEFNQDLNAWDVTSVSTLRHMFGEAVKFNQNLCAWDLSQAENTYQMFYNALEFNQNLCSWRKTFPYVGRWSDTFVDTFTGTACSTTDQPTRDNEGPFCAQCSDTDTSTCSMTPTAPSPTTTTSAPTPSPWSIEFVNMSSNFGFHTSSTNEALVLMYNIGKGRDHDSFFYAGLCLGTKSMVDPTGVITKNEDQIYDSTTPAMSALKLSYDFNMSMISSSNIWNNITKKLELCHVTRLMHKLEEPGEDLVIVESFYNLTIFFDLLKNFTIDIGLDEATTNRVNDTADISSYVDAYYCDGSDAMNKLVDDAELAPNKDLSVCFMSESTDIEIAEITSMMIKGVDDKEQNSQLTVMADGKASIPSITSFRFVNTTHAICTTRVPINMFDYERDDASIIVAGALTTNLQGSTPARKLRRASEADTKGHTVQDSDAVDQEALFDFSVNLKSGESAEEEEISLLKSDAEVLVGFKGLFFICELFATTCLLVNMMTI